MKVNEYIEEALQDLLQARTYITNNNIPIVRMSERDVDRGNQFVEIESEVAGRLSENHNLYGIEVALKCTTKLQEDLNTVKLDALYADVSEFAQIDLTPAGLNVAITAIDPLSGIDMHGKTNIEGDLQTLEGYEYREQRILFHLSYT